MSKEELLNSILESTGTGFCRSIGPEDLVQAAYNRAIEDAAKLAEGDTFVYVPHVIRLKIRE